MPKLPTLSECFFYSLRRYFIPSKCPAAPQVYFNAEFLLACIIVSSMRYINQMTIFLVFVMNIQSKTDARLMQKAAQYLPLSLLWRISND